MRLRTVPPASWADRLLTEEVPAASGTARLGRSRDHRGNRRGYSHVKASNAEDVCSDLDSGTCKVSCPDDTLNFLAIAWRVFVPRSPAYLRECADAALTTLECSSAP